MTIAAVGFDLLGLFRAELSGPAAVGWNLAYIVGTLGGRAPCGPFEKPGSKNSPTGGATLIISSVLACDPAL